MNLIEVIFFTILTVASMAVFSHFYPLTVESVRWFITIKHSRISKNKKAHYMNNSRMLVTHYYLPTITSLLVIFVSLFWSIQFTTIWNQLLQFLSL
jgi:hypothetical protein